MKKIILMLVMFVVSYAIYSYAKEVDGLYFVIKYGFPNIAIRIFLTIIMTSINLVYMYVSVYQYEYIKENLIIRLGKVGYLKKVLSIYLMNLFIFIFFHAVIDFMIIGKLNIGYIVINTILLLFPLIYLKRREGTNSYFLFYSGIFILVAKLIIFNFI